MTHSLSSIVRQELEDNDILPWHVLSHQLVPPCVQTDWMSSKESNVNAIQHTSQVVSPNHQPVDNQTTCIGDGKTQQI